MKVETLLCGLCGNYDDRKPPALYAGETCVCCNKGTLRAVTTELDTPVQESCPECKQVGFHKMDCSREDGHLTLPATGAPS